MRSGLWLAFLLAATMLGGCRQEVAGGRADGAAIYAEVCARCHGPDGIPDPGNVARIGVRPLTSDHVQKEMSDDDIRRQIERGSVNRQMPAFAGALSKTQIAAIVQHVRSLGDGAGDASAAVSPSSATK